MVSKAVYISHHNNDIIESGNRIKEDFGENIKKIKIPNNLLTFSQFNMLLFSFYYASFSTALSGFIFSQFPS